MAGLDAAANGFAACKCNQPCGVCTRELTVSARVRATCTDCTRRCTAWIRNPSPTCRGARRTTRRWCGGRSPRRCPTSLCQVGAPFNRVCGLTSPFDWDLLETPVAMRSTQPYLQPGCMCPCLQTFLVRLPCGQPPAPLLNRSRTLPHLASTGVLALLVEAGEVQTVVAAGKPEQSSGAAQLLCTAGSTHPHNCMRCFSCSALCCAANN